MFANGKSGAALSQHLGMTLMKYAVFNTVGATMSGLSARFDEELNWGE